MTTNEVLKKTGISRNRLLQMTHGWYRAGKFQQPIMQEGVHYVILRPSGRKNFTQAAVDFIKSNRPNGRPKKLTKINN
mgnify:CR=1 FL=1